MPLAQLQPVFGKAGNVLFPHLNVGLWNDALLVAVVTVAPGGDSFRAYAQLTFPYGVGQYQLSCRHRVLLFVDGGNGAVAKFLAVLLLTEVVLRLTAQQGGVQVFEHLRKRHVPIVAAQPLGVERQHKAAQQDSDCGFLHVFVRV